MSCLKKNIFRALVALSFIIPTAAWAQTAPVLTAGTIARNPSATMADVLGVVHDAGLYNFTTDPFLVEGANAVAATGTHVIKLWFTSPQIAYPFNETWPTKFSSMALMAQNTDYNTVFTNSQFNTIILEAFEHCGTSLGPVTSWKTGLTTTDATCVTTQFHDLTVYLRNNAAFAGKTFILQDWESDNAINQAQYTDLSACVHGGPSPTPLCIALQGYTDYMNARQAGITAGRADTPTSTVVVAGALELKKIPGGGETFSYPLVVDVVAPYTNMDLYSWSDYSSDGFPPSENYGVLSGKLAYIRGKIPSSTLFGTDNLYIGEFSGEKSGITVANWTTTLDTQQRQILGEQIEQLLKGQVRWIAFWNIYSNGGNATSGYDTVWLRLPNGAYTAGYSYFQSIMSQPVSSYTPVFEVENASHGHSVSPGTVTETEIAETSMSGGLGRELAFTGVGQSVSFGVYIPYTGRYDFQIRSKKGTNRGIVQASIAGYGNLGSVVDGYATPSAFVTTDLATINVSVVGYHTFTFTTTGKNAASSGYELFIDSINAIPVP